MNITGKGECQSQDICWCLIKALPISRSGTSRKNMHMVHACISGVASAGTI